MFAYLASEEHVAVLGQQLEYEQKAGEDGPGESRQQGESEMKDEGEVEGEGRRARIYPARPRPYIYISVMLNPLNAQLQEMRRVSEGEPVVALDTRRQLQKGLRKMKEELERTSIS